MGKGFFIYDYNCNAFFINIAVTIADNGKTKKVPVVTGVPVMIRQIYMDYHLPLDPWSLTVRQIHFFYDPLIPGLVKLQKNAKEQNKNGK